VLVLVTTPLSFKVFYDLAFRSGRGTHCGYAADAENRIVTETTDDRRGEYARLVGTTVRTWIRTTSRRLRSWS
jgi:hypothetical protein